jgi:hypothetical protein
LVKKAIETPVETFRLFHGEIFSTHLESRYLFSTGIVIEQKLLDGIVLVSGTPNGAYGIGSQRIGAIPVFVDIDPGTYNWSLLLSRKTSPPGFRKCNYAQGDYKKRRK